MFPSTSPLDKYLLLLSIHKDNNPFLWDRNCFYTNHYIERWGIPPLDTSSPSCIDMYKYPKSTHSLPFWKNILQWIHQRNLLPNTSNRWKERANKYSSSLRNSGNKRIRTLRQRNCSTLVFDRIRKKDTEIEGYDSWIFFSSGTIFW